MDCAALVDETPIVLTIVGLAVPGTLLNASGLDVTSDSEVEHKRYLKVAGYAHVSSGLSGGKVWAVRAV